MQKHTEVYYDAYLKCCYAYTNDGTKFLFDLRDADLVRSRGWHISRRGYVAGKEKRRERPLHKLMIIVDSGYDIDHVNRDKMDCRRCSLRVCSHHNNCFNQSIRANNTSGYIGVSYAKNVRKYESYVHRNGTKHLIGYFTTPQEAALFRDEAAKILFGEFCSLNFPDEEVSWWAS